MPSISVYEPPGCCSSGVCGPEVEESMAEFAAAHGATASLDYEHGYPATVNHRLERELAARAAAAAIGAENVGHDFAPMMGAEDFSYMLEERPGCYVFIGNGEGDAHPMCHSPDYDFNDDILPIGMSYWVRLVEEVLGPA